MPHIKIDFNRCKGCSYCVVFCPKKLIAKSNELNPKGFFPAIFKKGKCTGCATCVVMCPECAIEVYE